MSKNDSRLYTDWLEYAENDITAANILYKNSKTLMLSAFHCQQAIEKIFKGYFLYKNGFAPDGHNIIFLCKKAYKQDNYFMKWFDECIELNNYYIQTRYPPDFPLELHRTKVEHLCQVSNNIYEYIFNAITEKLGM